MAVYDSLHFLESRPLTLLASREAAGDGSEDYLVGDEWGNRMMVFVPSRNAVQRHIAASAVLSALGLAQFGRYPFVVRRGVNGIPTEAEMKAAGKKYSRDFLDGQWRSALVAPATHYASLPDADSLTAEQVGEHFLGIVASYAMRANGEEFGFSHGHVFVASIDSPLHDGVISNKDLFRERMKKAFRHQMHRFTPEQMAFFLERQLEPFLRRMESLATHHLHAVLDPATREIANQMEARIQTRVYAGVQRTMLDARGLTEQFLRSRVGGPFAKVTLAKPLKPSLMVFDFAALDAFRRPGIPIQDKVYRRRHAKKMLLAFHQASVLEQPLLYRRWQAELEGQDPIALLLEEGTRWDTSVGVTAPLRLPPSASMDSREPNLQLFLNRNAPKTLVVFAESDAEGVSIGKIIRQISKEVGAEPLVMPLRQHERLKRADIENLVRIAAGRKFERVIVCELGGVRPEFRSLFSDAGLKLVEIDHHSRSEAEWEKQAAVEFLARIYNYHLDLLQLMVAIRDRAGSLGYRQLGLTKGELHEYLRRFALLDHFDAINAQLAHNPRGGSVPYYKIPIGLGKLAGARNLLSYPEVETFVARQYELTKYVGDSELAWKILRHFEKMPGLVWGGDYGISMYILFEAPDSATRRLIRKTIYRLHAGETLVPYDPQRNCPQALILPMTESPTESPGDLEESA